MTTRKDLAAALVVWGQPGMGGPLLKRVVMAARERLAQLEEGIEVNDYYLEQAEAWVTFDENDACKTCGAQVSEFNQVTHYRWHQSHAEQGSAKPADTTEGGK